MSTTNTPNLLLVKDSDDEFYNVGRVRDNWDKIDAKVPQRTTADITLYVRTDGNDANDGSADDAAHALLTIQAAINKIPQIVNHPCTIYVAPGTYPEDISIKGFNGGKDRIAIYGDSVVSTSRTVNSFDVRSNSIFIYIRGFNVVTTTTNAVYALGCINVNFDFFNITAVAAQIGIYVSRSMARITSCTISNRSIGIYSAQMSTASVSSVLGTGNGIGINTTDGGAAFLSSSTITGTISQKADGASIIINSDGTIGGLIRGQQVLTTARTLYVRTDGNDSNDGLSNTAGGAFLTIQAAINSLPKRLDANVTINVATGTYSENVIIYGFNGVGSLTVMGDTVTGTTRSVTLFDIRNNTTYISIKGFNITTTSATGIIVSGNINVKLSYMNIISSALAQVGIQCAQSLVVILYSTISNRSAAIQSTSAAMVCSQVNSGTGNTVGIQATSGGFIGASGSHPAGTTPQQASAGGVLAYDDTPIIRNNSEVFEFNNAGVWSPVEVIRLGNALPASTGTMTVVMNGTYKPITPTGSCTFNASGGRAGQRCTFEIATSGTTSYTLTWGTGFRTTGSLTTGTVSGKIFMVSFVFDGASWIETGRTVAM